jgi:hypothetical protein
MFSIGASEMRSGDGVLTDVPDSEERLERAKASLAVLDSFGLQPHFDEFWHGFALRHGLEIGEPVRANTTEPESAPAHLIERIRADNALDVEFYAYAERLYRTRRATA